MSETFTWWGSEMAFECSEYNSSRFNERAVEIPIAKAFLRDVLGCGPQPNPLWFGHPIEEVLEVGNVLAHYGVEGQRVVDLYEEGDGVENMDLFEIQGTHKAIVAISTLEHVRWDREPRSSTGGLEAMAHLCGLLDSGGSMLATIPLGYNIPLDAALMAGESGADRACTMVRYVGGWVQTSELEWRPYGVGQPWASSVWVGEWTR